MTCEATPNAISLPEWGFGRTPCDSLGGLTTDQFGQALAPANLSARQAKALDLMTSGTYGPRSSTSSRSAALRRFAENRLRARTDTLGSTLYKLTWKDWPTPSGRSFSLLRASAVRTSDTGFGGSGWPTPTVGNSTGGNVYHDGTSATGKTPDGRKIAVTLPHAAQAAGWPTPHVGTPQSMRGRGQDPEARRAQGRQVGLQDAVRWAGWTTPSASDGSRGGTGITDDMTGSSLPQLAKVAGWPTPTTNMTTGAGEEGRGGGMNLQTAAPLASWPTPQANDAEKRGVPTTETTGKAQACLPVAVPQLAAWVTPSARDWKDTPGMSQEPGNRPSGQRRTDQLPRQAYMAGWATTDGPARLTVSGEMLTGFSARMESGGQLNPEHARWLMACPSQWARSAPGWQDYAVWQELLEIASDEQRRIASEPCAATATP